MRKSGPHWTACPPSESAISGWATLRRMSGFIALCRCWNAASRRLPALQQWQHWGESNDSADTCGRALISIAASLAQQLQTAPALAGWWLPPLQNIAPSLPAAAGCAAARDEESAAQHSQQPCSRVREGDCCRNRQAFEVRRCPEKAPRPLRRPQSWSHQLVSAAAGSGGSADSAAAAAPIRGSGTSLAAEFRRLTTEGAAAALRNEAAALHGQQQAAGACPLPIGLPWPIGLRQPSACAGRDPAQLQPCTDGRRRRQGRWRAHPPLAVAGVERRPSLGSDGADTAGSAGSAISGYESGNRPQHCLWRGGQHHVLPVWHAGQTDCAHAPYGVFGSCAACSVASAGSGVVRHPESQ